MFFGEIVGGLPLMDVVFGISVVKSVVVVVDASAYFQVSEANASGQSSKIVNGDIVPSELVKDFVCLYILDVEDLRFGDAWVVGAIGDWSGVVVAVHAVEEHDTTNKKLYQAIY